MRIGALLLLLCFIGSVNAAIYESTNQQGNVVFSNVPGPNSREVHLDKLQTYQSSKVSATRKKSVVQKAESTQQLYQSIDFVNLKNHSTIRNNNSIPFDLTVELTPSLAAGDRASLLVDGKVFSKTIEGPVQQLQFRLLGVERGEHQLQVRVQSIKTGKVLLKSAGMTVYFQQNFKKVIRLG